MRIDIITLLPRLLDGALSESIIKRAQDKGLVEICIHNLRDYCEDKESARSLPGSLAHRHRPW